MAKIVIKRLASGGVITNYNCVSRCGHCLYNSGPHRSGDYLEPDRAELIFKTILRLGCRSIHIGGGEPMLHPQKLVTVALAARKAGTGIDYVETNSAWFVDPRQADEVLGHLLNSGVHTLLVSMSPFHNEFIPFARVKGVIEACRRTGMQVFPWVNAFVKDLSRLDEHKPHDMGEFEALFGTDYLKRIPDRYWVHLGGRSLNTFREVYPAQPVGQILAKSPLSCARALSDTSHFHIDLYGNYIPGLCSGLAVQMTDLGRPLPDGKYPLLEKLWTTGIKGFHELAEQDFGYAPSRERYLNHCDLCTDIRNYLVSRKGASFTELAPQGFYGVG